MIGLAVFVKTPGLSPIKTRLASSIGQEKAEAFYRLSCQWTLESLLSVCHEGLLKSFWAVAEDGGESSGYWDSLPTLQQGEGSLGDRLGKVYEDLLFRFGKALVLGADSPELKPEFVRDAIEELQNPKGSPFVIGKTPDGGFYLFGGRIALPRELWTSVTYSQNTTVRELESKIRALGGIRDLPQCADVDTVDDLRLAIERIKLSDPKRYSSLLALKLF